MRANDISQPDSLAENFVEETRQRSRTEIAENFNVVVPENFNVVVPEDLDVVVPENLEFVAHENLETVYPENLKIVSPKYMDIAACEITDPIVPEFIDPVVPESIDPVVPEIIDPILSEIIDPVVSEILNPVTSENVDFNVCSNVESDAVEYNNTAVINESHGHVRNPTSLSDTEIVMNAYGQVLLDPDIECMEISPLLDGEAYTYSFSSSSPSCLVSQDVIGGADSPESFSHTVVASTPEENSDQSSLRRNVAPPDISALVSDDTTPHSQNNTSSDASSKKEGGEVDLELDQFKFDESSEESTFCGFATSHDSVNPDSVGSRKNEGEESADTSMDEYVSAVESQLVSSEKSEPSSSGGEESTVKLERRYPARERRGRKILTYERPGKPKMTRFSMNSSGEPRIKRFSIFAINNNPH